MGRFISWLLILLVAISVMFLSVLIYVVKHMDHVHTEELPQIETEQEVKEKKVEFDDSVFALMNKSEDEIVELLGEPSRKDPTPYHYTWWIYDELETYMQIGILDGEVVTVFIAGDQLQSEPIAIGDSYEDLTERFSIERNVTYDKGISQYTFILKQTDIETMPLIKLDDHLFVQPHIDQFTKEVSSIRIITGDLLLTQRFYEMEYRGTLPSDVELTNKDWQEVQEGMEKQVVDLTNVFRHRKGLPTVQHDTLISEVAYFHSEDMYEQQYFSHESKDGRGLKERLEAKNVYYVSAGENIAAQHSDAIAAMQGWLNSEGHRETMFNETYNYLGVGVYRLYYTQNFIYKY